MGKLAIIAGGGRLPEILVDRCQAAGTSLFVAALKGQGDASRFSGAELEVFRLGAVGAILKHLKSKEISDIVLAGSVRRPKAADLIPDFWTARFLARTGAMALGDDGLLKAILSALEDEEGFRVLAPHELVPELLTPKGQVGGISVGEGDAATLAAGIEGAKGLGQRDVGQAVIVKDGRVIAEEGQEGTEAMIMGSGPEVSGGILVKAMKPGQEARVDLPAIGPDTVEQARAAGLRGIAVEAGHSLILDRPEVIRRADHAGMFVFGFEANDGEGVR